MIYPLMIRHFVAIAHRAVGYESALAVKVIVQRLADEMCIRDSEYTVKNSIGDVTLHKLQKRILGGGLTHELLHAQPVRIPKPFTGGAYGSPESLF